MLIRIAVVSTKTVFSFEQFRPLFGFCGVVIDQYSILRELDYGISYQFSSYVSLGLTAT